MYKHYYVHEHVFFIKYDSVLYTIIEIPDKILYCLEYRIRKHYNIQTVGRKWIWGICQKDNNATMKNIV